MKKVSNPYKFYTKMISEKSWTNSESFNEFEGGTRMDLVRSHGITLLSSLKLCDVVIGVKN